MRRVGALLFLAGVTLSAADSRAAEACTDEPAVCGRKEFEAGVKAFNEGNAETAAAHFRAAYDYKAHPVVLFNLALAEAKAGRFLEAAEHFATVVADAQTPKDILEKAASEKERAESKIAVVEVEAAGNVVEATIDGQRIAGDPPVARLNPGAHQVRVVIDGKEALSRTVRLVAGERLRLTVDRSRELVVGGGGSGGGSAGSGATSGGGGAAGAEQRPGGGLDPLWFYVGAGATAVAGGFTIWSALDTQSSFDQYERDLPTFTQVEADRAVADGHAKERRTNVLLAVSGVAALGTAALGLFFVDWSDEKRVSVGVTPTGATLHGRF